MNSPYLSQWAVNSEAKQTVKSQLSVISLGSQNTRMERDDYIMKNC